MAVSRPWLIFDVGPNSKPRRTDAAMQRLSKFSGCDTKLLKGSVAKGAVSSRASWNLPYPEQAIPACRSIRIAEAASAAFRLHPSLLLDPSFTGPQTRPNKAPEPTLTVRPFSFMIAALETPSSLWVSVAHL